MITMSFVVLPSSAPSSGSFEVTDMRSTDGDGSRSSAAATAAWTVTYLWFGGQRRSEEIDTKVKAV